MLGNEKGGGGTVKLVIKVFFENKNGDSYVMYITSIGGRGERSERKESWSGLWIEYICRRTRPRRLKISTFLETQKVADLN